MLKRFASSVILSLAAVAVFTAMPADAAPAKSPLDFKVRNIEGKTVPLSRYKGKVTLFVNTASQCGFTPQYASLETLYGRYKGKGLRVLGFPANDFGNQEPGTDAEIKQFCSARFNTTFDMFSKVTVAPGAGQSPLYAFLTGKDTNPKFAGPVQWNFTKFLVDDKGQVVARFDSSKDPLSPEVVRAVEAALAKKK
ncbi:MAG: glutathione peroxidase [Akkermansiaceae bacterium]|nr:glutathione peroxidase [Armatimonadota bacterium]